MVKTGLLRCNHYTTIIIIIVYLSKVASSPRRLDSGPRATMTRVGSGKVSGRTKLPYNRFNAFLNDFCHPNIFFERVEHAILYSFLNNRCGGEEKPGICTT